MFYASSKRHVGGRATLARAPGTPHKRAWSRTGWRCMTWAVPKCQPSGSPPSPRVSQARTASPEAVIVPREIRRHNNKVRPTRAQPCALCSNNPTVG